ncbi:LysR family transcriptional regulator [Frateuria aurantia]|uniref:Transcriptional regulator n=1 Tax=Frateuria aurantia (strain ATCC 33424 / DSM 6220 / KCTC 2777 / LMG 1558 / NBRC 3245 / NCIMB 13370) TaxID=767434 RepID=H8L3K8_FRAAD|nr:LysR family transcriptional regulator [Frateuria aurantia]AFC87377.1 transcriptional regulator [Frateuria aurantia DSM 6220]
MDKSIGWEWYRTLLAVLQTGSLSAAARSLGITQPTAGRHVAALESALGQPLFTRSQTGLLPNETARALQRQAEAMQSLAAAMQRTAGAAAGKVAGTVRLSASEVVAVEVLPPILVRLRRRHPGLAVEVVASNQLQNLLQQEVDIAVRMTAPRQEQLLARRIGAVTLGLYAHVDYLAAAGMPSCREDLAGHALIGFDQDSPFLRAARDLLPGWNRDALAWRSDSDLAQLALLRAGGGIGVCQLGLAEPDPRLRRVLPQQVELQLETWVTMHEDLRESPRCRATFDALVEGLQVYAGGL